MPGRSSSERKLRIHVCTFPPVENGPRLCPTKKLVLGRNEADLSVANCKTINKGQVTS